MKGKMVKKFGRVLLAGAMTAFMLACGGPSDQADEELIENEKLTEETVAENNGEEEDSQTLPAYDYPGPEFFYSVLYQYLIDELGENYETSDVTIPCPIIIKMDESDKEDIKIWGNFWIYNYKLNGDTLETESGGSYPGCIHMKDTGEGYEVVDFEQVPDGSDSIPTAKEIFGKYYNDYVKSNEETNANEATRAQIIANYVFANNLEIKAYKDYGWDPVELPEENIDNFYSQLD